MFTFLQTSEQKAGPKREHERQRYKAETGVVSKALVSGRAWRLVRCCGLY